MKKSMLAHLLLGAAVAAALLPTAPVPSPTPADPAPTSPALTAPPQALAPLGVPEWLPAAGGSSCNGVCDTGAAEILLSVRCNTTSAASCCGSLPSQCQHFDGTCAGDAEIVCQF